MRSPTDPQEWRAITFAACGGYLCCLPRINPGIPNAGAFCQVLEGWALVARSREHNPLQNAFKKIRTTSSVALEMVWPDGMGFVAQFNSVQNSNCFQ